MVSKFYLLLGSIIPVAYGFFGNLFGSDGHDPSSKLFLERRRGTPIDPPALHMTLNATRGVHPSEFDLYTGAMFKCKSGSTRAVDSKYINDGFADCEDASDEPGTSAVGSIFEAKQFVCVNEEHRPISISSSHVDDGVCDCCDGSDEGILAVCQNFCEEDKEAEMLEKADQIEDYRVGSKLRKRLVNDATKLYNEKRGKQRELEETLSLLRREKENLQAAFDSAQKERADLVSSLEKAADINISQMLNLVSYDGIHEGGEFTDEQLEILMNSLFESLESHVSTKQDTISDYLRDRNLSSTSTEHDEDEHDEDDRYDMYRDEDYDPDYPEFSDESDEVEEMLEMSVTEEGDAKERDLDENTAEDNVEIVAEIPLERMRDFVLYALHHIECHEQISLLAGFFSLPENRGVSNKERAVEFVKRVVGKPEECNSYFSETFLGTRFCGAVPAALKEELASFKEVPEASGQEEISKAEEDVRDLEKKVDDDKRFIDFFLKFQGGHSDGGAVGFLAPSGDVGITNNCVRTKDHQYDYAICFDAPPVVKQGTTRMGELDRVEMESSGIIRLHFTQGDHCWNHGPRVAEVSISCGALNEIESVSEPSTCVYLLEMISPSACSLVWKEANYL